MPQPWLRSSDFVSLPRGKSSDARQPQDDVAEQSGPRRGLAARPLRRTLLGEGDRPLLGVIRHEHRSQDLHLVVPLSSDDQLRDSTMIRLVAATASGPLAVIFSASAIAASSAPPGSASTLTRPSS